MHTRTLPSLSTTSSLSRNPFAAAVPPCSILVRVHRSKSRFQPAQRSRPTRSLSFLAKLSLGQQNEDAKSSKASSGDSAFKDLLQANTTHKDSNIEAVALEDQLLEAIDQKDADRILECLDELSFSRNSPNSPVRIKQTLNKHQFDALLQTLLLRRSLTLKRTRARELHRIATNSGLLQDQSTRSCLAMVLILADSAPEIVEQYLPAQTASLGSFVDQTFRSLLQDRADRRKWNSLQQIITCLTAFLAQRRGRDQAWTPLLWHLQVQKLLAWDGSRRHFLYRQFQRSDAQDRMVQLPAKPETFDILIRAHLQECDLPGARSVLDQRQALGYAPSATMFACLLQGYKSLGGHPDIYNLVLSQSSDLQIDGNVAVHNALLGLYAVDGKLQDAWNYFQSRFTTTAGSPQGPRVEPTAETYTILWRAFAQYPPSLRPNGASTHTLWGHMRRTKSLHIDRYLARAILEEAVSARANASEAAEWLHQLDQHINPFPLPLDPALTQARTSLHNIVLQGLLRYQGFEAGLDYLHQVSLSPNEETWWLFVNCLAAEPDVRPTDIMQTIDDLLSSNLIARPNAQHLRSTLSAYLRQNQKRISLQQRPSGQPSLLPQFPPPEVLRVGSTSLLEDFERPSSVMIASQMQHIADTRLDSSTPQLLWSILRDRVILAGMRPTSSHLLPILCSYGYQGDVSGAQRALKHGQEKLDIASDLMLYTKLIQLMLRQGSAQKAVHLLNDIKYRGLPLDVRTYLPLIKHYSDQGKVKQVGKLVDAARQLGTRPRTTPKEDLILTSLSFEALCNHGRRTKQPELYLQAHQMLCRALSDAERPFLVEGTLMEAMKQARRTFKKLVLKLRESAEENHRACVGQRGVIEDTERLMEGNFKRASQLRADRFASYKRLRNLIQEHTKA